MTSRPSQRRARTSVSNWTNVNACPRWVVSYGVTPHTYSLMVPSGSGFRVADRVSLRNTGTRADVSLQPASQPTARSGRESQTYGPDQRQARPAPTPSQPVKRLVATRCADRPNREPRRSSGGSAAGPPTERGRNNLEPRSKPYGVGNLYAGSQMVDCRLPQLRGWWDGLLQFVPC